MCHLKLCSLKCISYVCHAIYTNIDGIERVYRCLKDTKRAIILERFLAVHRFPPVTSVCIKRPKRDLLNSSKEDYLRLYFENKKKSGGGPVSEIKHITKEKTIIVTFKYADGRTTL